MKIITNQENFKIEENTAIAIGKFDGVHKGHQKLINEILKAKAKGLKTVIFTFDPPCEELFGMGNCRYLSTKEEKRDILELYGIDYLVEFPMNFKTAAIEAEDFISNYIVASMNARLVVCGDDLSFGNKGRGDYKILKELSKLYSFETMKLDKVKFADKIISSSLIRKYVEDGRMKDIPDLLGRYYSIKGVVSHGIQLGRSLGFPTVNIALDDKKTLPPFGVYYSNIIVDNVKYKSISNIGIKPTVKEDMTVNAESFIYDFDADLYGKTVEVFLIDFIRKENKFKSLSELETQVRKDIDLVKKISF